MSIQIIDNCLSQADYINIKETLLGEEFPWFYIPYKVVKEGDSNTSLIDYQFIHGFYIEMAPKSPYIEVLNPLLSVLNPAAILRIKANLTPRSENIVNYGMHVDLEKFKGKTAIYYVNNNNGYTSFEDGSTVESKENRLIVFDSTLPHAGTTCTDQKVRCVINFNFFEWN